MSLSTATGHEGEKGRASSGEIHYSKTCQNCFTLKIRCDRTQRNDICDRCARLGKQCIFRPAKRRDNSAKRDSRIQALEAQVQNLLRVQNPAHNSQQPLPNAPVASTTPPTMQTAPPDGDVIDEDILTIERADTLVEMFKTEMMPHFPFVIIPPHVTGALLRSEQPFLFLAILTVTSFHDLQAQEKMGDRFKIMVTEKVLYGGDDCLKLEYLQGLLVVLAWNQYHGQSKFYTQYLQLAISIAVDMRLDRKPIRSKPISYKNKRDPLVAGSPGTQTWGPQEQRAAAGIFYLSSSISKLLDKMNTFQCTHYIEEACLSLGQRAEYRTDKDLYHVIRLQRIIENIETLIREASEADARASYLRLRGELEDFRTHLTSNFSDSHLLFMQFHIAKLFLYQVAFLERNFQQSPASHIRCLCEALESANSFLDLYLWLPPKSEMALTNTEWIQLSFGVTQAAKFAIISKAPDVEPQTRELRQRLNIDHIFRHLCLRIGALVGRGGEGDKQKDIFLYYEKRVRKIRNWYENMSKATGAATRESQPGASQQVSAVTVPQPMQYAASVAPEPPTIPPPAPFSYQQPQSFDYSAVPGPVLEGIPQAPSGTVSMAPLNTYSSYGTVPTIAFPDLMSAPGWDTLFSVPMEDTAWLMDVSQELDGMSATQSDLSWESSSGL